ncbi:MAG: hypothetical protein ACLFMO_07415 [Eubacteriales bacterium]
MSYLLKREKEQLEYLSIINNNLYYKLFPNKSHQRLTTLARNVNGTYTATLDENKKIHIIYKNNENKIIHLNEENKKYNRTILLDDKNDTYKISNIKLITFNQNLFLFYTALNPYDNTYDLIFHQINDTNASPQSLISLSNLNSSYDLTVTNNKLYLLCITKQENYELCLYSYDATNNNWLLESSIKNQSNPILYTTCCNDASGYLHLAYINEQFGQNQLYYINTNDKKEKLIHTSPYEINPVIFKYKDFLWINWIENKKNNFVFSIDQGVNFSNTTKASLQDDFKIIHFVNSIDSLNGNKFYGSVNQIPTISILSNIDIDNILLTNNLNKELNLLIKNLQNNQNPNKNNTEDIEQLIDVQKNITSQYNDLSEMAKRLQEEGKKWKTKCLKSELEVKKLKKEIGVLKSNNTTATREVKTAELPVSENTTTNEQ